MIDETELEAYAQRAIDQEVDNSELELLDPELALRVKRYLRQGLVRLNKIPADDPLWRLTNRRPTVGKLGYLFERELGRDPDNEDARWGVVSLSRLHDQSPDFGARDFIPLVRHDPSQIRWLIDAALGAYIWRGLDALAVLDGTLQTLKEQVPNFESRLHEFSASENPHLRRSAELALAVLQGNGHRFYDQADAIGNEMVARRDQEP